MNWGALFSNPFVKSLLSFVLSWLWKKADKALKDAITNNEIDARVSEVVKTKLSEYEKIILELDDLKDSGKLTEADKERIRNEKIKIEESIINDIHR